MKSAFSTIRGFTTVPIMEVKHVKHSNSFKAKFITLKDGIWKEWVFSESTQHLSTEIFLWMRVAIRRTVVKGSCSASLYIWSSSTFLVSLQYLQFQEFDLLNTLYRHGKNSLMGIAITIRTYGPPSIVITQTINEIDLFIHGKFSY